MTNTIEADTLRQWLDAQQPVTVLDVRSDEDRAQWAIPGSVHINAYDALRAGQAGPLAAAAFAAGSACRGRLQCRAYEPGRRCGPHRARFRCAVSRRANEGVEHCLECR